MRRLLIVVVIIAGAIGIAFYTGCGAATTESGADGGTVEEKDAGGGGEKDAATGGDAGGGGEDGGVVASDGGDGCDAHIAVDFPCTKTMECAGPTSYYKSRTRPCAEDYPAECCSGANCEALGTVYCQNGGKCVPSGDPNVDDTCAPGDADGGGADAGDDTGAEPDAGQDAGTADDTGTTTDAGGGSDVGGGTPIGTLTVTSCSVPFVLDATKISNMSYMTSHFADLVQQYCITGTVGGAVLESYKEKMYFGSHSSNPNVLSLTQMSMASVSSPQYSVKIDFDPDTAVTTGSQWAVGTEASAAVVKHLTAQSVCLFGWGDSGSLTFGTVSNVTATEGGKFAVSGTINVVKPDATLCAVFQGTLDCCP